MYFSSEMCVGIVQFKYIFDRKYKKAVLRIEKRQKRSFPGSETYFS